jgi:hypothetical protein
MPVTTHPDQLEIAPDQGVVATNNTDDHAAKQHRATRRQ